MGPVSDPQVLYRETRAEDRQDKRAKEVLGLATDIILQIHAVPPSLHRTNVKRTLRTQSQYLLKTERKAGLSDAADPTDCPLVPHSRAHGPLHGAGTQAALKTDFSK